MRYNRETVKVSALQHPIHKVHFGFSFVQRIIIIAIVTCLIAFGWFTRLDKIYALNMPVKVFVNGDYVDFDQPPLVIEGRTLIPIRAVSEKLGILVKWDAVTQTTTLNKNQTELVLKTDQKSVKGSNGSVLNLDVPPRIYGGRTLLPLRVVVETFGYEINYNAQDETVLIEEQGIQFVPKAMDTQPRSHWRWAQISSVQQFLYKDQGLAYAYVSDKQLIIQLPNSKPVVLAMLYPKLGDVISDESGNLYVVWGKDNPQNTTPLETVFISKYTNQGTFVKSAGFEGESSPWGTQFLAKTKVPFDAGNSVSVIASGILVNYHSKERYDGHQSDQVVAVNLADMTPYKLSDNTFSGHSFNQALIYSEQRNGFLFASHGDAYPRGFRINGIDANYGDQQDVIFHFFMPSNANYDMSIVNETYAQLGNIAQTSAGVALVGASAKSIGKEASDEPQNLFVQIFNPNQSSRTPDKFIGGIARTGATAFDINDKDNRPLVPVTDYGVQWLTQYADRSVVAPQVVVAKDQLVIFWSTSYPNIESFYMVLSATGQVRIPATSLGEVPLNAFERPIFYNGAVYWAAIQNERLKVRHIVLP